jgi:cytochrome b
MTKSGAVKVWDAPTRLFHWSIALLFAVSWYSAKNGAMDWHYRAGLTALGLILFRILWGLVGASTARFARFLRSPAAVLGYVRRPAGSPVAPGHNPIGGYSVAAMLLALSVQVGTGLFAVDVDGLESGPLSYLVSFDQGRVAAGVHEVSFNLLLGLIGLHVLAIAYYHVVRSRNLVGPMISGRDRQIAAGTPGATGGGALRFVCAAAVAGALAWWIGAGLPTGR